MLSNTISFEVKKYLVFNSRNSHAFIRVVAKINNYLTNYMIVQDLFTPII